MDVLNSSQRLARLGIEAAQLNATNAAQASLATTSTADQVKHQVGGAQLAELPRRQQRCRSLRESHRATFCELPEPRAEF